MYVGSAWHRTEQSPGSIRGFSLWCLPRTLSLSTLCRLGCSNQAFGGCFLKGLARASVCCEVRDTVFLLGKNFNKILVSSQHNQWICFASEGRAQDVSHQSLVTTAQSEVSQCVPSTGEKCFKFPGQIGILQKLIAIISSVYLYLFIS